MLNIVPLRALPVSIWGRSGRRIPSAWPKLGGKVLELRKLRLDGLDPLTVRRQGRLAVGPRVLKRRSARPHEPPAAATAAKPARHRAASAVHPVGTRNSTHR